MDDPNLSEASLLIGLEQYEQADELLRTALAEATRRGDPKLASRAHEGLGTIATRRGREAQAREALELALELGDSPPPWERPDLYLELARLRANLGDLERSAELLEESRRRLAEQADPDPALDARFAVFLSYAYSDAGEYGKALSLLAELIRGGAEDIDVNRRYQIYYALARVNFTLGRAETAATYADLALETAVAAHIPQISDSHLLAAHIRLDLSQTEAAGTHLAEARRLQASRPGSVDLGFLLVEEARLALQLGDFDEAAARAREAIERLGDLSFPGELGNAYLVLARVYEHSGETDSAENAYTASIDAFRRQNGWPVELARAYRHYGKLLRSTGRPAAAIEMLEAAADLTPD